jgi:hypothetical protein
MSVHCGDINVLRIGGLFHHTGRELHVFSYIFKTHFVNVCVLQMPTVPWDYLQRDTPIIVFMHKHGHSSRYATLLAQHGATVDHGMYMTLPTKRIWPFHGMALSDDCRFESIDLYVNWGVKTVAKHVYVANMHGMDTGPSDIVYWNSFDGPHVNVDSKSKYVMLALYRYYADKHLRYGTNHTMHPHAMHPHAMHPHAMHPHAMHPHAMHPHAMHPTAGE